MFPIICFSFWKVHICQKVDAQTHRTFMFVFLLIFIWQGFSFSTPKRIHNICQLLFCSIPKLTNQESAAATVVFFSLDDASYHYFFNVKVKMSAAPVAEF